MTIFNVRYTTNGINVYNYDYYYGHLFMGYSKLDDIGPAVRLVTLYNRHELINDRVMERLFNCIRNGIYVTCSMYDEFKSLEDEKEVDR